MKKIVSLALALCLALSCLCSASANGIITLGTGSTGGTDNVVIEALSSVVNSNSSLRTSTSTTTGGAEIIYLIQSGDLQGGYTGTIDLVNALNGAAPFTAAVPPECMLQAFGFVTWALPIVVLDSSDIKSYEDLEGRHIGLPPAASSTTAVLNLVLEAYGLTAKVTIDYFTWSEGYTAMKDGRIDAFVGSYANGSPISGIIEIEATNPIRCLNMSEEVAEAVKAMNPGVGARTLTHAECATIPEGETVLAPANSGVVVFSAEVSEDDAYTFVKTALEHVEDLKAISAYFDAFMDVAAGVCVETVPFHPGAAKALQEAGLWNDNFIVYGK
ncbi:MAG: TAXI family TRAP transporter solute-binding subunit [Clostridia bacterium]|nr:TAXI family TRAP transporter solute-binding subunit [Clostridia bacterium]